VDTYTHTSESESNDNDEIKAIAQQYNQKAKILKI